MNEKGNPPPVTVTVTTAGLTFLSISTRSKDTAAGPSLLNAREEEANINKWCRLFHSGFAEECHERWRRTEDEQEEALLISTC